MQDQPITDQELEEIRAELATPARIAMPWYVPKLIAKIDELTKEQNGRSRH